MKACIDVFSNCGLIREPDLTIEIVVKNATIVATMTAIQISL